MHGPQCTIWMCRLADGGSFLTVSCREGVTVFSVFVIGVVQQLWLLIHLSRLEMSCNLPPLFLCFLVTVGHNV